MQLTKMDVRALRQADRVCFYHGNDVSDSEAPGVIRAVKELHTSDPFGDREREYMITGIDSYFVNYSRNGFKPTSAFAMEHHAQNAEWLSVAANLHAGDSLVLRWIVSNSNGHMKDADLVQDILYLEIRRTLKSGRIKVLKFYIYDQIGPRARSMASMVR